MTVTRSLPQAITPEVTDQHDADHEEMHGRFDGSTHPSEWNGDHSFNKQDGVYLATAAFKHRPYADITHRDFNAQFDETTDGGAALQDAMDASVASGARRVKVPHRADNVGNVLGCLIQTGVDAPSGVTVFGDGKGASKLINDATNPTPGVGNKLFRLEDVDDVHIEDMLIQAVATGTFEDTASYNPEVGVSMAGVVRRCGVERVRFVDHQNFALEYAVDSADTASYYEDLDIDIEVDGETASNGSGVIFYPHSKDGNGEALSKRLRLRLVCDVSRGQLDVTKHGPQCAKIQNTDDVKAWVTLRGGAVNCLSALTGVKNLRLWGPRTACANIGLNLSSLTGGGSPSTTGYSKDFGIYGHRHLLEGATNGGQEAARFGCAQSIEYVLADVEGDLALVHDGSGNVLERLAILDCVIRKGLLKATNPGALQTAIGELIVRAHAIGGDRPSGGRFSVAMGNWPIRRADVEVTAELHDGHAVNVTADVLDVAVRSVDGNPNNTAGIAMVAGNSAKTRVRRISKELGPAGANHVKYAVSRTQNGSVEYKGLAGLPETDGVTLAGMTSMPQGDLTLTSPVLDLEGAATDTVVLVAPCDLYLLGFEILYTVATSVNAGVAIRIGNLTTPAAYATRTSAVNQAIGATTILPNDGSFTARYVPAGTPLTIGTAGGKAGTGKAIVTLTALKVL